MMQIYQIYQRILRKIRFMDLLPPAERASLSAGGWAKRDPVAQRQFIQTIFGVAA
jgi:hypothetical protein